MDQKQSIVVLMGKPGSGKGTQGKILAERLGVEHFSTGEQFKKLREEESILGARVRDIFDSGKLLPDWFATYLFEKAVFELPSGQGMVLDGYPRTVSQAHEFAEILSWLELPYKVLEIDVADEEVTARMLKRATLEHRPDSATEEQIAVRLGVYQEQTAPVLEFFQKEGTHVKIDGSGTVDDVQGKMSEALA